MPKLKRAFSGPPATPQKSVVIRRFGGLELRGGVASLDPCRSPNALNMILDDHQLPAKRTGFKRLRSFALYGGDIQGLHTADIGGEERLLIHAGTQLWLYREDGAEQLYSGLAAAPSTGFAADGSYFLMDGTTLYKITGRTVQPALSNPYIPLTRKSASPSGTGGAGESPNLLTDYRRNSFLSDGETAVFKLDAYPVAGSVTARLQSGETYSEGQGLSVYAYAGTVTFQVPPSAGAEGVVITYRAAGRPVGMAGLINRTTLWGRFGGTVFLSGNPDLPGREWGSPDIAAAYFPDALQGDVGDPGIPIAGYIPHQEGLVILKRPGGDGPSAIGGIGRVGSHCLYLSREGLMEITAASRSSARRSRPCGTAIAPLLGRAGPADVRAFSVGGYYYLQTTEGLMVGQVVTEGNREDIEWNHWQLPFAVAGFGSLGGRLYACSGSLLLRLCEPGEAGAYLDNGEAIAAHWSTPLLDMGETGSYKRPTDLFVTLRPHHPRGSATVSLGSDWESPLEVGQFSLCRFDWNTLDFADFGFGSLDRPTTAHFVSGMAPAVHWQVTLSNNHAGSAMNLGDMQLNYCTTGLIR